jgi:hypothetical protein
MIRCRDYRSIFPLTLPEARRLLATIKRSPEGCWLWTGYMGTDGYGQICMRGAKWQAHRMIYELMVGPVPPDCVLHHRCHNKRCCNPAHLEPATLSLHIELDDVHREGRRPEPPQAFCRRGHELTQDNVLLRRDHGKLIRFCRTCWEAGSRRRNQNRRRRRAAAAALRSSADASSQSHGGGVGECFASCHGVAAGEAGSHSRPSAAPGSG